MAVWHEIIIPIIFLFLILPSLFWLLLTCLFNCRDRLWIANFWKIWLKIRNKFWIYLNYILLWEYSVENEYKKTRVLKKWLSNRDLIPFWCRLFRFFYFLFFYIFPLVKIGFWNRLKYSRQISQHIFWIEKPLKWQAKNNIAKAKCYN